MIVVITGAGGYIGTVLVPKLLAQGHQVRAIDRFYFGESKLDAHKNLQKTKQDVRLLSEEVFKDADAVIDLAAISNDPSGELFETSTYDINYKARAKTAELAKKAGVKRYILPSSCSIYGFHEADVIVDESSEINPLTTYAKANRLAEEAVLKLADENFCVTVMRQATIYGLSRRMRFDLAVNAMTYELWKNNKLPLMRDGKQWRPFLHIQDTTDCMIYLLSADKNKINGEIFNIGSNSENYQIGDLAENIQKVAGENSEIDWYGDPDERSYRVDFSKIENITGWKARYSVVDGSKEIVAALEKGGLEKTAETITLEWYKKLKERGENI